MGNQHQFRLGIVGCGSVSEQFHAPALRGHGGFIPVVMVDCDPARARRLANGFDSAVIETDHRKLAGRVDAAIVALPGHLNARVSADLLQAGVSVLVEKPAAVSVEEAEMLAAAPRWPAILAVGFIRREAAGVRLARQVVQRGLLGKIRRFSIEDGHVFAWQAVHEFRFDRARGGGILNDIGSHVLDCAAFWFGPFVVRRSQDDNAGGVETNARFELETACGVPGTVELSWTRVLRNSAVIEGENGTLEVCWYGADASLTLADGQQSLRGAIQVDPSLTGGAETFPQMFLAQIERWHARLRGEPGAEMAGADDALTNVRLVSECRARREDLDLPWRKTMV